MFPITYSIHHEHERSHFLLVVPDYIFDTFQNLNAVNPVKEVIFFSLFLIAYSIHHKHERSHFLFVVPNYIFDTLQNHKRRQHSERNHFLFVVPNYILINSKIINAYNAVKEVIFFSLFLITYSIHYTQL